MYRLEDLNPVQQQAVVHKEGPLLILAGAGSGKTRVLTYRIAHLIAQGVESREILAITFTNKAAQEMRERAGSLVGSEGRGLWVTTFHSACVRILRQEISNLPGYTRDFVIYDSGDQQSVLKTCLKECNLDDKKFPARAVGAAISDAKNKLLDQEDFEQQSGDYFQQQVAKVYRAYQKRLKTSNALDFDDLIMLTVLIFRQNPEVLRRYQERFRYILVDEYQDTNHAQYILVKLLAARYRNLCVVGDDDQCVVEGTSVMTPQGKVSVEKIRVDQGVLSPSGCGEVIEGKVDKIARKRYTGPVVKITTATGQVIKTTPNHIGLGRLNADPDIYYIYLMYKHGLGYRIGQTKGVRKRRDNDDIVNGLFVRLNQEHADKIWILKTCKDKGEASFYEHLFSVKYGIPTAVFHTGGRELAMSQELIERLFREVDTHQAVVKLMEENLIFEEYPHYVPKAVIRGQSSRRIINISFLGGKKYLNTNCYSHRIALITSGDELKANAEEMGFPVRDGNRNTWRIETERKEYDEMLAYAKKIAQLDDSIEISKWARVTKEKSFRYLPMAHLQPSMSIPIYQNGRIVEDLVERVEIEYFDGYVYDLSVPHLRQFIAGGIVIHNSVYGWRGADVQNILDFERDYPEAKVLKLEQNYRSTQSILEAANSVVCNNSERKEKALWTENPKGQPLIFYVADDEQDESRYVAERIQRLRDLEGRPFNDFALLYRTNAQSRVLEERLMKEGIPYRIFSGHKFYERLEIKDILAYLRVLTNPADIVNFTRILNVPKRGLGGTSLAKVLEYTEEQKMPILEAILEADYIPDLQPKARKSLLAFAQLMQSLKELVNNETSVTKIVEEILNKTGYKNSLIAENTPESQTRLENLDEFLSVTTEYDLKASLSKPVAADELGVELIPGLSGFLEQVSLVAEIDNLDQQEAAVVLMTMHSAKGLEFPVVFIVGLEEGVFPGIRSQLEPGLIEEERRLCYVALTRAREKVYLCHAGQRMLYGRRQYNPRSRFLEEIPYNLLEEIDPIDPPARAKKPKPTEFGSISRTSSTVLHSSAFGSPARKLGTPLVENVQEKFLVGHKVSHDKFGPGIIMGVKGEGQQAVLTINFQGQLKQLVAEYAKLTRL